MNGSIAHLDGVLARVMSEAEVIGGYASARRDFHYNEGQAKIEVRHHLPGEYGDIDSDVSLVDPAALSIEFGHWNARTQSYTHGTYIMSQAFADAL